MYLKINEKVLPFVAKLFTRAEKEKLKFIVTLREPVARYYSNYKHFAALALVEVQYFWPSSDERSQTPNV